jgi:aconitate hydratase
LYPQYRKFSGQEKMDTLTDQIIQEHIMEGRPEPGENIALKIDQTLTQDATGTLTYLELVALGIDQVKTELSVSYVDHNLIQTDNKNADDHLFLQSAAAKYGLYFSKPGNGISHILHLERFSTPGKTLLGSDSHTPTGGACAMLAIGAGGLDVAAAMAGGAFYLRYPKIMGVRLTGKLPAWVSAKDIVLELLRRLTVQGAAGYIVEYFGPGLESITISQRAVMANMGSELGATSSLFPSDSHTRAFLESQGRGETWIEISAQQGAEYNHIEEIDLSTLEPLAAAPSSPDNVHPVRELAGKPVCQVLIGSCSNAYLRDLMMVAGVLKKDRTHEDVSLEISPGSNQILENLALRGGLTDLIRGGARVHQSGCLGCIGMGQAPATSMISLRTFPRNFPGRSGTKDDEVYLVSPETAIASAIRGCVTDPRDLGEYPSLKSEYDIVINDRLIIPPKVNNQDRRIIMGPNIKPLPLFTSLPQDINLRIILKLGDNITTDHIMPAGNHILPLRSNIQAISKHVFESVDPQFVVKAVREKEVAIAAGVNYGQGSSREHAALAPRYLGVRLKLVKSFARIHKANLINFGIIPLTFEHAEDYDRIKVGDRLKIKGIRDLVLSGKERINISVGRRIIFARLEISSREREILASGGLINYLKG